MRIRITISYNYFLPLGKNALIITITRATIMIMKIAPELVNSEPRGTPDAFNSSPAVCASGTKVAYNLKITTKRTIPKIASLSIEVLSLPDLLFNSFISR